MSESVILYPLAVFSFFVIPGWFLSAIITDKLCFLVRLVLSFAFGLTILSLLGVLLNYTFGISLSTLLISYLFLIGSLFVVWFRKDRAFAYPKDFNVSSLKLLLSGGMICSGVLIWRSYIGFHAGDIGTHVFWAQQIIVSRHLPNYTIVEPYQLPNLYVFGPHLFLAVSSTLSFSEPSQTFPFALLLFYLFLMLAIVAIVRETTGSYWYGLLSGAIYVSSQIAASRIFLGNLDDLIGYFFLAAIMLTAICFQNSIRNVFVFLILTLTVMVYYQYVVLDLGIFIILATIANVSRLRIMFEYFKNNLLNFKGSIIIGGLVATAIVMLSQAHYISISSYGVLRSTKWPPISTFVIVSNIGNFSAFVIGLVGFAVIAIRQRFTATILITWFCTLLFIALLPYFGIGVEPIRFVWHMLEPLAVSVGLLTYLLLTAIQHSNILILRTKSWKLSFEFLSSYSKKISKIIIVIGLIILCLTPSIVYDLKQTVPSQPYLTSDLQVGEWLRQNANSSSVITVDSDLDNSATWVQEASQLPHFIYKVAEAETVAAPPLSYMYENISFLYDNPMSPIVMRICHLYKISYVVVPKPEVSSFNSSLFFRPVFFSTADTVFSPVFVSSYGIGSINSGYIVNLSNSEIGVIFSQIGISLNVTTPMTLMIPIHGQILTPAPTQALTFSVYLDGSSDGNYTIPDTSTNIENLGMSSLFRSLINDTLSLPVLVPMHLSLGTHHILIVSTSSIQIEIVFSELRMVDIAVNVLSEMIVKS